MVEETSMQEDSEYGGDDAEPIYSSEDEAWDSLPSDVDDDDEVVLEVRAVTTTADPPKEEATLDVCAPSTTAMDFDDLPALIPAADDTVDHSMHGDTSEDTVTSENAVTLETRLESLFSRLDAFHPVDERSC